MKPVRTTKGQETTSTRMGIIVLPWNGGRTICIDAADIKEVFLSNKPNTKGVHNVELSFHDGRGNYHWKTGIDPRIFLDMYIRARNGENINYRDVPNAIYDPEAEKKVDEQSLTEAVNKKTLPEVQLIPPKPPKPL